MFGKTALLVAAVLGALAVTSCSTDSGTEGSGTEASNVRKVPSFNAVEVSGQADAVVTVGEARKVTVRGDDNLLEHVETEVSGDGLEISQDEDIRPEGWDHGRHPHAGAQHGHRQRGRRLDRTGYRRRGIQS
jgi:Putative auto-transporter adhesin, head GIN domain